MKHYSIYQRLLKQSKNLKSIDIIRSLLIKKEDFDKLNNEKGLKIKDRYNYLDLSPELLKYILNDKFMYNIIKRRLKSNFDYIIRISSIDNLGNIDDIIEISKTAIVKALKKMYIMGCLNDNETKRFQELNSIISYEQYLQKIHNESVSATSYRGTYTIKTTELLNILSSSNKKIEELLTESNIKEIPKEEFLECIKCVFDYGNILYKCLVPAQIIRNKEYIEQRIDDTILMFEQEVLPVFSKDIVVNEMLWEEMWDKVPKDFNKLEKAYYIYYQLCKIFTYDEEAMVRDINTEPTTINHKDISRLADINKTNPEVVCSEFTTIYSKFLDQLEIDYNIVGGNTYSPNHLSIEFAYDKYKVKVDSTKSIINGDMPLAKRGEKLRGFSLYEEHKNSTKEEFNFIIEKVNEYIQKEENHIPQPPKNLPLTNDEKKQLLFNLIQTSNLSPTDIMNYILYNQKTIFEADNERTIKTFFVRDNNLPPERNKLSGIAIIICFNENFNEANNPTEYYIYRPGEEIDVIPQQELQEQFDKDNFSILKNNVTTNCSIPGINTSNNNTPESIYSKRYTRANINI